MGRHGKYSEAEEMHRKVPGMKEVVLGKEHPSTLMSINNLESVAGQAKESTARPRRCTDERWNWERKS